MWGIGRFIVWLAFCFSTAYSQDLRISVVDPSGATVVAQGKVVGPTTSSFRTDSKGRFSFQALTPGTYALTVSAPGFAKQELSFVIVTGVSQDRTISLAIPLSGFSIDVIASTPLAGSEVDRDQVPAPVQSLTGSELAQSGAPDLPSFLNRRLSGVHINEVQGNPFQPDLNYRGYTASPLLGTPQGISLYMDGVRFNQPFGDVVSWDLIPRTAIAETTLIPGSNPLFGLNTLGGAIAIETKSGQTAPGSTLLLSGGSWGRKSAEFQHGGHNQKGFSWYGAANLLFEEGWRTSSPSDVRQYFGKIGWQGSRTAVTLAAAFANNALNGNGLLEQRDLARNYSGIYTKPDITANRSPFVNLTIRHNPRPAVTIAGNVYYRSIRTNTLNSDVNENALDQAVYQPSAADIRALAAAGYTGYPTAGANSANTPFPFWRCIAQSLQGGTPDQKCNGLLNRSSTTQQNYGVSGQTSWSARNNQVTAGAAFDRRTTGFRQLSQLGYLNPDRSVTGVNSFGDGITGGTIDGEPFNTRVNVDGRAHTSSVYVSDTLSFARRWSLTASGRYNANAIRNLDRFNPGGASGSLDSNSVFRRFNPAAGFTYRPWQFLTIYASYSEGSRAPTSIELGCADPSRPCKLPNALASDPPLRQVIARTWEAGIRGSGETGFGWNAGWFRAENSNDLLFAASTQTGFGYFKNFGRTRRQGLEANLHGRIGPVELGGGYTFLDATYQSPETLNAQGNSTNQNGTIHIQPGNQIPLIPRNTAKAYALWKATRRLSVDLDLNAVGRSFARGNENNQAQQQAPYYLGPGISPGYAVLNFAARFEMRRHIQLFAQVNNLTGRRYYSAAQIGPTAFAANGNFIARPFAAVNGVYPLQESTFYAPGAPRAAWGGLRFTF